MNKVLPAKGIHRVRRKRRTLPPVEHHYAWRGGPSFWTSDSRIKKHSAEYWAAYKEAVNASSPSRGLFREIIQAYLNSPEFKRLKPRTQSDIQRSISHPGHGIDTRFGDAPQGAFNRPEIRKIAYQWRDRIASDRSADHAMSHLSQIVSWACDRNWITHHHLREIRKRYSVDRSDIIWSDDEIEAFTREAPDWLGRILVAATETGLRPGDLVRLSRPHIRGDQITMRTGKRQRMVAIPITQRMAGIIAATPTDRLYILSGARGGAITNADYCGRKIGEWKRALIKKGVPLRDELHLYDARGTAATRLFEANASLREIATSMGWSVQHAARMIEIYVATHPSVSDELVRKLHGAG